MFLSLGEVMLRFCPGDLPLRAATSFTFSEGGGEYNVARALSRCFEVPSSIATSLVENDIGQLVHQLIRSSGVKTDNILWQDFDGTGNTVRNALYFAERGFGYRSPAAVMDRANSSASQIKPDQFDWDALFSSGSISWFHTGGIFAGLSESCAATALQAMQSARQHGVHVSFDPNFRASLWQNKGGSEAAAKINRKLAQQADTLFGIAPLLSASPPPSNQSDFEQLLRDTAQQFPQVSSIAVGQRQIVSASCHHYKATVYHRETIEHANGFENIPVIDRIGSGDAFAAGYIAARLEDQSHCIAAQQGCAAAALTMSTPGDAALFSKTEVANLCSQSSFTESR